MRYLVRVQGAVLGATDTATLDTVAQLSAFLHAKGLVLADAGAGASAADVNRAALEAARPENGGTAEFEESTRTAELRALAAEAYAEARGLLESLVVTRERIYGVLHPSTVTVRVISFTVTFCANPANERLTWRPTHSLSLLPVPVSVPRSPCRYAPTSRRCCARWAARRRRRRCCALPKRARSPRCVDRPPTAPQSARRAPHAARPARASAPAVELLAGPRRRLKRRRRWLRKEARARQSGRSARCRRRRLLRRLHARRCRRASAPRRALQRGATSAVRRERPSPARSAVRVDRRNRLRTS